MIVVEGWVRLPPESVEKARGAMTDMIMASRAEDGCIDYAYALDVLEPGLVRVAERWTDRKALAAHFQTPHMARWREVIPTLGITERELRLYEAEPESL